MPRSESHRRKHKKSGSHIAIGTIVPSEHAAALTKQVAEDTKGEMTLGGAQKLRFEGAQPGRLIFSVRGLKDISELMSFHVKIESAPNSTHIRSEIDGFKTPQERLFYLIPFGPKFLIGYKTYRRFMDNLSAAVLAADSRANVTVTERV